MEDLKAQDELKDNSNEGSDTGETNTETEDTSDNGINKDLEDKLVKEYKYTGSTTRVHPILSCMVNYCQSVRFPGWKASNQSDVAYKMSSFSETVGHGHLNSSSIEMVQYNKRQFRNGYEKLEKKSETFKNRKFPFIRSLGRKSKTKIYRGWWV